MYKKIYPVAVMIGVAIWSVWPIIRCRDCIADYGKDGQLITWIINNSGQNLYGFFTGGEKGLFGGNIFYPYKDVLAYSDMFFVTGLVTYPLTILTHSKHLVSSTGIVAGQMATMMVIYFWWSKISKNNWAAVIGTTAFGVSQIRMEYQVHLQMWGLQYMLIAIWLITEWLEDKKNRKLYLGAGILGLQAWESLLPVYFAILVLSAKYLVLRQKIQIKKLLLAGVFFGLISALPLAAYWGVGREFNFRRDIREAAHNSISTNDIWGKFGSPGLYVLLAVAIWQLLKSQRTKNEMQIKPESQNPNVKWLGLVLAASLIMALGPVLKWQGETVKIGGEIPVPLPYAAAYYLIPGFDALRTPSRWMWVAGWAASGLVALGINSIRFSTGLIGLMLVAVIGGMRIANVRNLPSYETMPEVYRRLEKMPGKVVLEVPMGDENIETDRMIYSLFHGKTLVNGFSGYTPPGYREMAGWVNDGLSKDEISRLGDMGVEYVIYNQDQLISVK